MEVTRRHFLGISTGAAAMLSLQTAADESGALSAHRPGLVLLDLGWQCVLAESMLGYKKVLVGARTVRAEAFPQSISPRETVIVPGAGAMNSCIAQSLMDQLRKGSTVLFESGGGFMNPEGFYVHQEMLRRHMNIVVERPVNLWTNGTGRDSHPEARLLIRHYAKGSGAPPYIDYIWPHKTKVRDFSHVVPLAPQAGEVIGVFGKLPVALRKSVGKGTFIFLGSPLGPHLRASDPEAARWLHSFLAN